MSIPPFCRRKKEVDVQVAMRELHEKKEEERLTLELKKKIELNAALQTILNTAMVSQSWRLNMTTVHVKFCCGKR